MDTSTRLVAGRRQGIAWRLKTRLLPDMGWVQILIGLPLTVLMLAAIVLLALPDMLRSKGRRWERFGDH
jgi:hypothetical protein